MKCKTAAEYCDMSESAFVKEVTIGRLPGSVLVGGREHWDQHALDAAINRIAGVDTMPDYRRKLYERHAQA
ncbi:hypothetical protein [Novosphingopyxis sp. YJ-S2-01]|uniref:hypothetical protein n=1 Tax=Novosphingopyxis sp. YJ-S2-01 TaxID=2794021 RepID=UPI0018DB9589|nr:hypothetical protein [Novosphingopyxis sp. YJ-S2-01]MBH9537484.1 hypothetical protein [Novosphingopyxis sp. YJ-S2-01]